MRKKIAILGSTGSIGVNTLSVIEAHPELFEVYSLTANNSCSSLNKQILKYKPKFAALTGLMNGLSTTSSTKIGYGSDAVYEACNGADLVLLAIMGIAGLKAFEFCLKNRIPVALATKEAMVCGGRIARNLMDSSNVPVYPVDSELSAIWQCLHSDCKKDIKRILLTASGGPFRTWTAEQIKNATLEDALKHPNWKMGKKITVDSATMVNKGLEIMETRWLFDVPSNKIEIVIHPESIVHSMVEYCDNAILAQLGDTDMRIPILHAISYPNRAVNNDKSLDIFEYGTLHFEKPDSDRFPCLNLAYEAVKNDGELQLVFNCANEFAVEKFLNSQIRFNDIYDFIEKAMIKFSDVKVSSFDDIYRVNKEIRIYLKNM